MGKRTKAVTTAISDHDTQARVRVLEHSVTDLRNHVDSGFKTIHSGLAELTKAVAGKSAPIPFKEIAATVAVMLGIFAYVGQYLEGQYAKNIAVTQYRIEQLEKNVSKLSNPK